MRSRARLLIVALLLVGAAFTTQPAARRYRRWRHQEYAHRLAQLAETSASEAAAKIAVRRLNELPNSELPELVRLATSAHPVVRDAAQRAVRGKFDAWRILRQSTGSDVQIAEYLQILATALAANADRFDQQSLDWAQATARRLLVDADMVEVDQLMRIANDCEKVLCLRFNREIPTARTSAPQPPQTAQRTATSPTLRAPESPLASMRIVDRKASDSHLSPAPPPPDLARREPVEQRMAAEPPSSDLRWQGRGAVPSQGVAASSASTPPARPAPATVSQPRADATPALPLPAAPQRTRSADRIPTATGDADRQLAMIDVPSPEAMRYMSRRFHDSTTRQLLIALNAASADRSHQYTAAAIMRVLRQRGLSDAAIARLAAAEKKRAAADASRAPAAQDAGLGESSEQLRRMVLDDNPRVRRRALTMLATSNDPRLEEVARDRAMNDDDPIVAEIASRILEGASR